MHPRLSVNTLGYGPGPISMRLGPLGEQGITRLGVPLDQLTDGDLHANLAAVRSGGFEIVTGVIPYAFTLQEPGHWPAERDRLCAALDVAAEAGCQVLYTTTGPSGDLTWQEAATRFTDAVAPVASYAQALPVRFAFENTSTMRVDLGFVHVLSDAVDLAREAGLAVCADLFVAWTDRHLQDTIARSAADFAMVQIADFVVGTRTTPDRAVPGDGTVPIRRQLAWLQESGYRGVVELELIGPRITAEGPAEAAARALTAITPMLET
jgi:sugar phosphate isomerase/epimerase